MWRFFHCHAGCKWCWFCKFLAMVCIYDFNFSHCYVMVICILPYEQMFRYSQAGTPVVKVKTSYNSEAYTFSLNIRYTKKTSTFGFSFLMGWFEGMLALDLFVVVFNMFDGDIFAVKRYRQLQDNQSRNPSSFLLQWVCLIPPARKFLFLVFITTGLCNLFQTVINQSTLQSLEWPRLFRTSLSCFLFELCKSIF